MFADDPDKDPSSRGNQVFDLLSTPGTTTQPTSEPLVTNYAGVTIYSPFPHLSSDCLPEFNAQQAHNASVFNDMNDNPFLNGPAEFQTLYLPDPSKPPQGDENVAIDNHAWDTLRTAWLNAPQEDGQAVADIFASALGWDAEAPTAVNPSSSESGSGSTPTPAPAAVSGDGSGDNDAAPVPDSDSPPLLPPAADAPKTWVPLKAQPPIHLLQVATAADSDVDVGTGLLEVYYLSVPGFATKLEGFGMVPA